jgi:hypothetical protein
MCARAFLVSARHAPPFFYTHLAYVVRGGGGGCIAYLYLRILPKPFISDAFILVENKSLKVVHVLHGLHLQQTHHTSAHTVDFKSERGWSHPPIFQATTHPSRLDDNVVRAMRLAVCCS